MERLSTLSLNPVQRIGLSATQKPLSRVAEFLVGSGTQSPSSKQTMQRLPQKRATTSSPSQRTLFPVEEDKTPQAESPLLSVKKRLNGKTPLNETTPDISPSKQTSHRNVKIVDVGHQRELDLEIIGPSMELSAVCSKEHWGEINETLIELINSHRSTLIFVNTRRMAERIAHQLTSLLGEDAISSHHGSLASDIRLKTEQKLKSGDLKAVVATASLELGIDIGYIDLVIQIGSTRSIATFLQRIGRSGHALGLIPKGKLVVLTRDELIEAMALVKAIRQGVLDKAIIPTNSLDVMAQHIVSEVACREIGTDELYEMVKQADSYGDLPRKDYDDTISMLSEGITSSAGRSRVYLHHDQINNRLRARKGARIAAVNNAGAIPDIGSYRVVLDPENTVVGTVDEDFAVESTSGDIFVLGTNSWRIQGLRGNDLVVSDAHGAPPSIPFWRGEAPGRTIELSTEVSNLREYIVSKVTSESFQLAQFVTQLAEETCCRHDLAEQAVNYVQAQLIAVGVVPTQKTLVFERFFDETGGMQVVIHAPFGSRVTRGWGLAMRKRFCRSFDFELQATADDDGFILTLGPQHSFPLESLFSMLNCRNAQALLEQAVLAVPTFQSRWRWNVANSLIVHRRNNGQRVPPPLQRFRSDDLLTAVFPRLTGCQENITGDHEIPDHPLMKQTMHDCLTEAFDIDSLKEILKEIEADNIRLVARDTKEPSPFAYELLNANPYAFLDGANEVVDRRARTAPVRRNLDLDELDDFTMLDPAIIANVVEEATPLIRDADELHDVLLSRCMLPVTAETNSYSPWMKRLIREHRATEITLQTERKYWVPAERLHAVQTLYPDAACSPQLQIPETLKKEIETNEVRQLIIRGLLENSGPISAPDVAAMYGWSDALTFATLESLEGEGSLIRGWFIKRPQIDPDTGKPIFGRYAPPPSDHDHDTDCDEDCETELAGKDYFTGRSGDFIGGENEIEWCHRRLLTRIHRLSIRGLRNQVEAVSPEIYHRFLARHQKLLAVTTLADPASQMSSSNKNKEAKTTPSEVDRVYDIISQLEGYDLPAVAWEKDIFSMRVKHYDTSWLDELCFTGLICWGRLSVPNSKTRTRSMVSLSRNAPISLIFRDNVEWVIRDRIEVNLDFLSTPAQDVVAALQEEKALFANDLCRRLKVLPEQLTEILGELISQGLITADGFAGLRGLIGGELTPVIQLGGRRGKIVPERERRLSGRTGRWNLWLPEHWAMETDGESNSRNREQFRSVEEERERISNWAWLLLRRWGVVFRDLLAKESSAPPWYQLVPVYRSMEARGEIRGGRFIKGVSGEQYAVAESLDLLTQLNKKTSEECDCLIISTSDPLNLTGVISKGGRLTSQPSHRVCYLDGKPVAHWNGKNLTWMEEMTDKQKQEINFQFNQQGIFPGIMVET